MLSGVVPILNELIEIRNVVIPSPEIVAPLPVLGTVKGMF